MSILDVSKITFVFVCNRVHQLFNSNGILDPSWCHVLRTIFFVLHSLIKRHCGLPRKSKDHNSAPGDLERTIGDCLYMIEKLLSVTWLINPRLVDQGHVTDICCSDFPFRCNRARLLWLAIYLPGICHRDRIPVTTWKKMVRNSPPLHTSCWPPQVGSNPKPGQPTEIGSKHHQTTKGSAPVVQ